MTEVIYGGVNAAVLTAMRDDLSPDLDRTAAHARWLLANGCDGLGVLGTTGEANSFGLRERLAIVEGLVERGIPARRMMPGTGCASLADTVELTRHAAEAGCPGVLVLPPFYYKSPSEEGLFSYFSELAQRVGDTGVRIFLYHFPAQSAVPITVALIERLLRAYPGTFKGAKDSSGDFANLKAMIDEFAAEGFEAYVAADNLFQQAVAAGAAGSITAAANLNGRFAATVWRERTGPQADAAQAVLSATRAAVQSVPLIGGLREVLARSANDPAWRNVRPPNMPVNPEQAKSVWAAWDAAGALPLPGLGGAEPARAAAE